MCSILIMESSCTVAFMLCGTLPCCAVACPAGVAHAPSTQASSALPSPAAPAAVASVAAVTPALYFPPAGGPPGSDLSPSQAQILCEVDGPSRDGAAGPAGAGRPIDTQCDRAAGTDTGTAGRAAPSVWTSRPRRPHCAQAALVSYYGIIVRRGTCSGARAGQGQAASDRAVLPCSWLPRRAAAGQVLRPT